MYRSDPRLAHAVVEDEPRVRRLRYAMLDGMLARAQQAAPPQAAAADLRRGPRR